MKKALSIFLLLILSTALFSSCTTSSGEFNPEKDIMVISREDGSGTRGAFIELFDIEQKGDDGTRKDLTTKEAIIAKATDVLVMNVVKDQYAVGYISLGSLNNTLKPLEIDGAPPSAETIKNGTYKVSRPFNIVTSDAPNELTKDFIDYILSSDGQDVVSTTYISVSDDATPYAGNSPSGKIVIAGSSSVYPIMEKLKEAYLKINTSATIEIQQSDSSSGITGTTEGTCNIGMVSRDLTEKEETGLITTEIARDGIVIVANLNNPIDNLTSEQVKAIFTGEITKWSEVIEWL